jgi:type IV fimbrial biogenesis protein FimT
VAGGGPGLLDHQQGQLLIMRARGFSLIELLIAVAIAGILLALGASSYRGWISNVRIRTTGEAIQNGLQLARGEAVRRNTQISFQLMGSVDDACLLSAPNTPVGSDWVVSFDPPAGACAAAPLNEAFRVTDAANNPAPRIIQVRPAAEGSRNVVVSAGQTQFVFNGLGRLVANPGGNPVPIDVSNPIAGACVAATGQVRCLRVTVSPGGQIRLCDPAYPAGGSDPQRCF